MDYGRVIKDAWDLTWRHRFLWLLGFFVGGGAQSCGSGLTYNYDQSNYQQMPPESRQAISAFLAWVQANAGLLIALAILLLALGIVFLVVSFIAQGGLTRAGADLRRGVPVSPGDAWRYGLRFFWRYVGLFFLLALVGFGIALVTALLFALFFGILSLLGDGGRIIFGIIGALIAIAAAIAFVVFAIALGIVVTYAQRAIAIEDVGVFDALGRGTDLLQRRIGPSLVFWLLSIVLSIGAVLALMVVFAIVLVPLALFGVLIYFASTATPVAFIIYLVIAFVVFLAVAFVVSAIVNTFFWNYWTCAYLDLTAPATPEPVVPAEPLPGEPYTPTPPTEPTA